MTPQAMRAIGAGWIFFFLVWLPFEDTQLWMSVILALDACIWIGLRVWPVWRRVNNWLFGLATGAIFGAAIPLLTITLMAFKSGLHGHGFADFTTSQVLTMVQAIPFCLLAGVLLAIPLHLFVARGKAK